MWCEWTALAEGHSEDGGSRGWSVQRGQHELGEGTCERRCELLRQRQREEFFQRFARETGAVICSDLIELTMMRAATFSSSE